MATHEDVVEDEEVDPEREARRRLALAQIRQYPDAALKLQARPVDAFDGELESLVERMKRLMADAQGLGLAATQVGVLQRVFILQTSPDEPAARGSATATSWLGAVVTVETGPAGNGPTGVESA